LKRRTLLHKASNDGSLYDNRQTTATIHYSKQIKIFMCFGIEKLRKINTGYDIPKIPFIAKIGHNLSTILSFFVDNFRDSISRKSSNIAMFLKI